ncbi:zinc ABC transporter substrate-binding protein [Helicobacter sp. 11S02629-2]|uniref:metal ABC transporter solute-binding protein, Zn/Mn family n=1 Tax=Helicobacter sp. 11S02629-2 TaxID=1476195 RepID=UPI000BA68F6F|nr:zinc ABC transporter substrate-binding protein [Helicobacter sp. 11S02629-2]
MKAILLNIIFFSFFGMLFVNSVQAKSTQTNGSQVSTNSEDSGGMIDKSLQKNLDSKINFILNHKPAVAMPDFKAKKLNITVSIQPLAYFVKGIAGESASYDVLVPKNKNAETFEPNFSTMESLQNADLFIGVDMPFEKVWLPRVIHNNDIKTLILDTPIGLQNMPHIWLSAKNAKRIAYVIYQELSKLEPSNEPYFKYNLALTLARLDIVDKKMEAMLKTMPKKSFVTYHSSFNNIADDYGLDEISLQTHGKSYGMSKIIKISKEAKALGIKRVLAELEDANTDIKVLAKNIGAKVVTIDPLSSDYEANLLHIADEISKSYQP